mgnify:CR=1 FL=1
MVDLVIIGGGPAGLAAACKAWESGLRDILILERDKELGGILNQCIHNGFGLHRFGEQLTGPEYAGRFIEMLKETGVKVQLDTMVLEVTPDKKVHCVSKEHGYQIIEAKSIILGMGCRERTRGAIGTPGTRPAGVYTAGAAQRYVNMEGYLVGKRVLILGSGDIGLIMARRMTLEGAKVLACVEVMPYSGGLTRNIVQCLEDNDIPLHFNTTVVDIHGKERVEGVTIAEVDPATRAPKMETARFVPCDTLLLSVGLIPENELTKGTGAQMDRVTSGAQVDAERQTTVPGIFACGNVLHVHDLVDNVSEEAAIAGENAAKFALGTLQKAETVRVLPEGGARYVVPQRLVKGEGKAALYFRVSAAFQPARLTVTSGGKEIKSVKKRIMTPGEMEKTVIDRSVRNVYRPFLAAPDPAKMPILGDLYDELLRQPEPEAARVAAALELYVSGSLNVFNHRTNVELSNRLVCFDIKQLGKQLKKLGMLIVQDQVWNRVTINRAEKKSTRYYMDEFHLLLKEEQTAAYSVEIWKRFRKWGGIPTAITQNVKDLLSSREVENIFENSDFVLMLNQAQGDREILARQLNISPQQMKYVTHTEAGEGLIFYGNVVLPFLDRFPQNTELYRVMTTRPEEVGGT